MTAASQTLETEIQTLNNIGVSVRWAPLHPQDGQPAAVRVLHLLDDGTWHVTLAPGHAPSLYRRALSRVWEWASTGVVEGPWAVHAGCSDPDGVPWMGLVFLGAPDGD